MKLRRGNKSQGRLDVGGLGGLHFVVGCTQEGSTLLKELKRAPRRMLSGLKGGGMKRFHGDNVSFTNGDAIGGTLQSASEGHKSQGNCRSHWVMKAETSGGCWMAGNNFGHVGEVLGLCVCCVCQEKPIGSLDASSEHR